MMSLLVFFAALLMGEVGDIKAFEESLLKAETVQFDYHITSTGEVTAEMKGHAAFAPNNQVNVHAEGTFLGEPKKFKLQCDGKHMHSPKGSIHTPSDLVEALLVGYNRMGLLHNLAVMSMGGHPDGTFGVAKKNYIIHADGEARREKIDGKEALGLPFYLEVGGKRAAKGILWLHGETGLPLLRKQTVHFENGDMHVEERYSNFSFNAPLKHEIPRLGH